jgi:hypothetical protein
LLETFSATWDHKAHDCRAKWEATMAGDIGISETIVVAPAAGGPVTASLALRAEPILHEYGPGLKIGVGAPPPPGVPMVASAPVRASALSPNEQLGLAALRLRESAAYISQKKNRAHKARAWSRGPTPLHRAEQPIVGRGAAALSAAASLNARPHRLAGRIAVGIIMVSGPGKRALGKRQQIKIAAEVQNGLSWLGAQSPAKDVTWVHDNHHLTVNVPQAIGPTGDDNKFYEHFEKPWRDAALAQLGFRGGPPGVKDYLKALKRSKSADSAYCAFFTLYRLNYFAYCTGPYLMMHYKNDGWGTNNIDRVFAHESGHVFGAPDEYKESECTCKSRFGLLRKPNLNCEGCAPNGGVKCIMKGNDWAMCSLTPYHFGYNGLPKKVPEELKAHVVRP